MYHAIFLLDYIQFRQEAEPFVEMADKGEYAPIIEKANEIAAQITPEEWILEDLGTTLRGFSERQERDLIAEVTGFSFLVLLSQFLKSIPLPTPGLGNVAQAVALLDWSTKDVDLLRNGMATTTLLKPDSVDDPLKRPPGGDPRWHDPTYYWWWLRPGHAFYTGWWDIQQLERLNGLLLKSQAGFEQVDIENLHLHPSVTRQTLRDDYEQTIKLFEFASLQQTGLLAITK